VARRFRPWQKKRGDRRTGSHLLGSVGEAFFFAALFVTGAVSLAQVILARVLQSQTGPVPSGWALWLVLLVLVSLIVIGAGGVIYAALHVGASAERRAALARKATDLQLLQPASPSSKDFPTVPRDTNLTNSPGITLAYRLPIARSPALELLGVALFGLLWNGVVCALAVVALNAHLAGQPDWSLTALLLVFSLVGMAAIGYFFRLLMVATGIGPTSVEISDHPLYPGGQYKVFLTQSGRLAMRSLELWLACDEEATYRQGTDMRNETRRVFLERIFQQTDFEIGPGRPFEHLCELEFPRGAMHSFQSGHNTVAWKLIVRGEAARWPPYERTFPVIVYPDPPTWTSA